MGTEEAVAEVVLVDLVREIFRAVRKGGSSGRTHAGWTDVGILERVDVDGEAQCVLGKLAHTGFLTVVEAGSVVGRHRGLVVPAEIVDEPDAPDRIAGHVKVPENRHKILGDGLVANQLPYLLMAFEIDMGEPQIAKVRERNLRAVRVGDAAHTGLDDRRNGFGGEDGVHGSRFHNGL